MTLKQKSWENNFFHSKNLKKKNFLSIKSLIGLGKIVYCLDVFFFKTVASWSTFFLLNFVLWYVVLWIIFTIINTKIR